MAERADEAASPAGHLRDRAEGARIVGVTGAPGCGKSTLVDALATRLRAAKERVAILAVDSTSPISGGAMLGDRLRMQAHAADPGVFVRSMATRGALGGLAPATAAAAGVLDAAGWPWVLIETVGTGQVGADVAKVAGTVVVVVTPDWGDGVQAEKAGILELADVLVVNKGDRPGAERVHAHMEAMVELSGSGPAWHPPVITTVATTGDGIDGLRVAVLDHLAFMSQPSAPGAPRAHRTALRRSNTSA